MIIHMSKIAEKTTTASARIAKWLAEKTGLPLVDSWGMYPIESTDIIYLVNSPTAFCNWIPEVVERCLKAKTLVWVMNDYTLYPPTQLRDALGSKKMRMFGTVPRLSDHLAGRWTYRNLPQEANYVNWNLLTLDMHEPQGEVDNTGIMYWGAYRKDREQYFDKYFNTSLYEVLISSSMKAATKFEERYPLADVYGPALPLMKWLLEERRPTIYMEDEYSHEMYCSPANRFYEAVSAGLPVLIDKSAAGTLIRAGFEVDQHIVESADDVAKFLPEAEEIAKWQESNWMFLDGEMEHQFDEARKTL